MNFRVGQKITMKRPVVWADAIPGPVFGDVCVVTYIGPKDPYPVSYLCVQGFGNNGYRIDLWRPVVERPTDISVFTKMLEPQPKVNA